MQREKLVIVTILRLSSARWTLPAAFRAWLCPLELRLLGHQQQPPGEKKDAASFSPFFGSGACACLTDCLSVVGSFEKICSARVRSLPRFLPRQLACLPVANVANPNQIQFNPFRLAAARTKKSFSNAANCLFVFRSTAACNSPLRITSRVAIQLERKTCSLCCDGSIRLAVGEAGPRRPLHQAELI